MYIYIYIIYHFIYISFCIYLCNVANDRRCIYLQIVTVPDPRTTIINGKRNIDTCEIMEIMKLSTKCDITRWISGMFHRI